MVKLKNYAHGTDITKSSPFAPSLILVVEFCPIFMWQGLRAERNELKCFACYQSKKVLN